MQLRPKSKYVSLQPALYELFGDKEMLRSTVSNERANLVIVKLRFNNNMYNFAIPWRSNITANATPTSTYFQLPPTSKTKDHHVAGLDFRKMCILPNKKKNKNKYYTNYIINETKDTNTVMYIEKNKKTIIARAQNYLNNYDNISSKTYSVDLVNCFDELNKKDLL
ncbi:MAG: hypothetical protein ABF975_01495 [Liquorilactobacillus hordei]|uniref:hypothetical protein n=1 Tax=Liquorilactobacillus hordei TaxID=468911 RepID=UPI0039E7894F